MMRLLERAFLYSLAVPAFSMCIYFESFLYPYLTPKTLLIRGAFICAIAIFFAFALLGKAFHFERLRNKISWIPGAILVLAYISSMFGVDFYHSFWSSFDRGDGLLTLTAIVGFFYMVLLYVDAVFVRWLLRVVSWTASFVALFGVLQWIQWATGINIPLLPDTMGGRVGSTLGNPTFFSSIMGMTFLLTLVVARDFSGVWKKILYAGLVLQVLAILTAATRGTLVALTVAGGIALLYQAWRGNGTARTYARFGVVALLVVAGLFVTFRSELARVPFEPIARLASISTSDATVESRLFIWGKVVGGAFQQPLLGEGAEHIEVLFNHFYNPTSIVEEWFDRTHNAFLDYFVQYGFLGFFLYLLLVGVFLLEAWKLMYSSDAKERLYGRIFLLIAIIYAVQNFFVFDTAISFWLFLMFFVSMLVWKSTSIPTALPIRSMPKWIPLGGAALIALLVIPVSYLPMRANLLLAQGYLYQIYDVRRSVDVLEKGLSFGTYADREYGFQLYNWYTERQIHQVEGEGQILAYRVAHDVLEANYAKYPYDARTATYYAHILDFAPKGEEVSEENVLEVLHHAIELSPKRVQLRYLLANISINKGDSLPVNSAQKRAYYLEAIQGLSDYSELVPNFAEPHYIIATLYQTLGDNALAAEWAAKGLVAYTKPDLNTARRAARYYVKIQDWEHAAKFLTDASNMDSENYPVMYDLAKAEFLSGNTARAKEIVEILREKAKGLVETDQEFLTALERAQ